MCNFASRGLIGLGLGDMTYVQKLNPRCLLGLNVQIVEPGPDYRPCESHDNGTTLVRARLIATVGVDFEIIIQ